MRRTIASPNPSPALRLVWTLLEDLKDFGLIFERNADAVVADRDHRRLIVTGRNLDCARPGIVEVLERVADEIGENLPDGVGVARDHRKLA